MEKIEFKGRLKKVDIFSDTLHIIIFPKGSLTKIGRLYDFKEGQELNIVISALND